ncbi:MAG: hypothetical protein ACK4N5_24785 [Myxococcales bacterium]
MKRPVPRSATRRRHARCGECGALEHCHDTLIEHADGTVECTSGPGCAAEHATHERVLQCDELDPCGCAATP